MIETTQAVVQSIDQQQSDVRAFLTALQGEYKPTRLPC